MATSGGTHITSVAQLLTYADAAGTHHNGTTTLDTYSHITSISYNAANGVQDIAKNYSDSEWIDVLVKALRKCGIPVTYNDSGHYDENLSADIATFQRKYLTKQLELGSSQVALGVLGDFTVQMIFEVANGEHKDVISEPSSSDSDNSGRDVSNSPHYQPFFDEDNAKQFRQNHKDIKIVFGNSGIIKTLHDVVMRSVGVEVDTSGNPISEVYEFIARDVTESDEAEDSDKYENDVGTAPSDIQYKFNFKTD